MNSEAKTSWLPQRDLVVYVGLALLSVIVRIPFFSTFNLVSFDGTYYLGQAQALFSGGPPPGNFPLGYPLFVAILLPVLRDPVVTGQVVSLLAGVGSVLVVYAIAATYMKRELAALCALFVSALPLVIRLSLATFSESLYTFWVLFGLLMFIRGRDLGAGLSLGVASITRPEVLGLALPLAFLRIKKPRAMAAILVTFCLIYTVNPMATYLWHGRVEVLPKAKFFGSSVMKDWRAKEKTVAAPTDAPDGETGGASLVSNFVSRLPRELGSLALQVGVLAFLASIVGAVRRPTPLLLAMLPVLAIPLFTVRSEARYLLPYAPIVVIYAFVALSGISQAGFRKVAYVVVAVSLIAALVVNRDELTQPVDEGHVDLKRAGLALRGKIEPGAVIADRKPYLAFYAGARYLEIPDGEYEETMQYLVENDVDYLSLHLLVVAKLRRSLWPLVGEEAAILGERRFEQMVSFDNRIVVYKRVRDAVPLDWQQLTAPTRGGDSFPEWSPDGSQIAYVSASRGNADIYAIAADGGGSQRMVVGWPGDQNHPAWSPDGNTIAFTSEWRGQKEIHTIDLTTKKTQRVVEGGEAPSWSPDGSLLAYHIDGPNGNDLVTRNLETGEVTQLSHNGNNSFPVFAPYELKIAWVRERELLSMFDLRTRTPVRSRLPKEVGFRPTWSPDGRFVAVTARDWGSTDVYIVTADGRRALLLTTNEGFDGYPAWSPDGRRIAVVSVRDGGLPGIWLVSGLEPAIGRLTSPPRIDVIGAALEQAQQ